MRAIRIGGRTHAEALKSAAAADQVQAPQCRDLKGFRELRGTAGNANVSWACN
jgi:hypothetical protein